MCYYRRTNFYQCVECMHSYCRNAIAIHECALKCIANDAIYFNEEETELNGGNKTEEILVRWGKWREDEW